MNNAKIEEHIFEAVRLSGRSPEDIIKIWAPVEGESLAVDIGLASGNLFRITKDPFYLAVEITFCGGSDYFYNITQQPDPRPESKEPELEITYSATLEFRDGTIVEIPEPNLKQPIQGEQPWECVEEATEYDMRPGVAATKIETHGRPGHFRDWFTVSCPYLLHGCGVLPGSRIPTARAGVQVCGYVPH